ncbi:protein FAM200A isoform X2 [Hylobates moloch]|uniref:protein FAM200A isoform X2 n=1 Tax=Hylobates moloch TaxID=81572 RepID=UPI0013F296C0|nr:protein FAM200A isoform X2 [Hylobates moloch]
MLTHWASLAVIPAMTATNVGKAPPGPLPDTSPSFRLPARRRPDPVGACRWVKRNGRPTGPASVPRTIDDTVLPPLHNGYFNILGELKLSPGYKLLTRTSLGFLPEVAF